MIRRMNRLNQWMILVAFCGVLGCAASRPEPNLGPLNPAHLRDGVYQGESQVGPVSAAVEVVLEEGRITRIELLRHRHMLGGAADPAIRERIVASQSTRVDAVSGATGSSRAIMQAVENALQAARVP